MSPSRLKLQHELYPNKSNSKKEFIRDATYIAHNAKDALVTRALVKKAELTESAEMKRRDLYGLRSNYGGEGWLMQVEARLTRVCEQS
jgi:hypothetical protein